MPRGHSQLPQKSRHFFVARRPFLPFPSLLLLSGTNAITKTTMIYRRFSDPREEEGDGDGEGDEDGYKGVMIGNSISFTSSSFLRAISKTAGNGNEIHLGARMS